MRFLRDLPRPFWSRILLALTNFAIAFAGALLNQPILVGGGLVLGVLVLLGAVAFYRADQNKLLRQEFDRVNRAKRISGISEGAPATHDD